VEVLREGRPLALGAPKQRTLLALLLLNANEVVSRERAIDCVWGESPPERAVNALQVYVHGLRKAVGAERIATSGSGYVLRLQAHEFDLPRFQQLVEEGREALEAGSAQEAEETLRRSLSLWRGEPLADLPWGSQLDADRERLVERRLEATELLIDAELALDNHATALAELETLVRLHPFREGLYRQQMLALYRADRQADALAVFQSARRVLADELGIDPSPGLRELERAILRHDPSLRVMPTTGVLRLPRPPTRLIGRQLEVAAICAQLQEFDCRLLTLTGPGGIGKTRLAIAAASELGPALADGAVFVELAPIHDPALVPSTIAAALELAEQPRKATVDALAEQLQHRDALVVLDNFERVLAAAPLVAELLARTSRLRVLATSRVPLHVSGEQEYPVPPLPLPATTSAADVLRADAVKFFAERVRRVDPGFAVDESNAVDVAEICHRLEGMPLALELAAPRMNVLSPAALLARLERQLDILADGPVDLPERHQTLRATLDWSYALLSDEERRLLARLAVFVGGWTLDSAEAVCGERLDVVSAMAGLLDASLLRRQQRRVGDVRFRMLTTVREYALGLLAASGEERELRQRHALFFLDLAERADQGARSAGGAGELEQLEVEHDNLRAALGWLHDAGEAELELRLTNALSRFWWLRGHTREARRWLAAALERADDQPRRLRAETLRRAAVLAGVQGDHEVARSLAEQSRALYEEEGDVHGVALSVSSIAESLLHGGDYEEAGRSYEHARSLFRELGDDWDVAAATVNLAYVALGEDDPDRAAMLAEEGLVYFRDIGDPQSTATAIYVLGAAAVAKGEESDARSYLEDSLRLFADVGDREGAAECLHALAATLAVTEPSIAAELTGAAETLREDAGSALAQFQLRWRDATVDTLRRSIGDDAYSAAFERGRELELDAAVERAAAARPIEELRSGGE